MLVSLVVLLLPWGGCQYVQEMEQVLRENHGRAMIEQTALLARMVNQAVELPTPAKDTPFYTPIRYQPVEMDGYDDDWRSHTEELLISKTTPLTARLQKGLYGDDLYLFLQVNDVEREYHHPGRSFQRSDHVRLVSQSQDTELTWVFFTSGPGRLQVYQQRNDGPLRAASYVDAWWQEFRGGYQLEIRIPQNRLLASLDLQIYDREPQERRAHLALSTRRGEPSPWWKPVPELQDLVHPWRTRDTDLTIVGPRGWPLAPQKNWLAETVQEPEVQLDQGFPRQALNRFYRFWVDQLTPRRNQAAWPLPLVQVSRSQTRLPLEKFNPDRNRPSAHWYRSGDDARSALLVTLPLYQDQQFKGFLVFTQSGEALLSLTNDALRRVTNRVAAVLAIVVSVLILFASVLSWRIRQLKRQAEAAISSEGRVSLFEPSRREDEIGDLSRSYHQLLQRVRNYTGYLETLGGKLAHELRTPLAIVKSSLELAQATPGDNDEYLQRALEGTDRLRQILSAMSEASRVEQSIQQTEFQPFDLRALVDAMTQAYADTYPDHDYQSHLPDEVAWINGNPELLAQLLDKLVDNARDFAPPGTTIELGISRFKHQWLLTVSNQGPTLPPNLEGQLFDSLVSQRDAEHKGASPHLGLGLYIVRLIALAHHGQAEAHNRAQGDGVIFTITLPEWED
jgi:dedicated sortase system histidine kinase